MPCNTIRQSTINLAKVDHDLLKAALETMGMTCYVAQGGILVARDRYGRAATIQNGKLTHDTRMIGTGGQPLTENMVKQAYSGEVVKSQAKKFGWAVRQTADNQYVVVRR